MRGKEKSEEKRNAHTSGNGRRGKSGSHALDVSRHFDQLAKALASLDRTRDHPSEPLQVGQSKYIATLGKYA